MTLSDSLSLSSYSSWLLLPPPTLVTRWPVPIWNPPRGRLCLLCRFESCWTVSPVVMISSAAEDSEDEDGSDVRSIQDSGYVKLVHVHQEDKQLITRVVRCMT